MAPSISIDKQSAGRSIPQSYLAVVSPCSTCPNQRAEEVNGLPACPRQKAIVAVNELKQNNMSSANMDPLALTGNEDNPDTSNTALVNPVYSEANNTILVWIASVKENTGYTDANGNVILPDLFDPNFDQNYIKCRPLPVFPEKTESAYFHEGAWAEWDQINVFTTPEKQVIADPNTATYKIAIPFEGVAKKTNLVYYYPRLPVDRDYSSPGT